MKMTDLLTAASKWRGNRDTFLYMACNDQLSVKKQITRMADRSQHERHTTRYLRWQQRHRHLAVAQLV
jgi:hypothetical protein